MARPHCPACCRCAPRPQIAAAHEAVERQRTAVAGELARLQQDVAQHEADVGRPLPELPEGARRRGPGGRPAVVLQLLLLPQAAAAAVRFLAAGSSAGNRAAVARCSSFVLGCLLSLLLSCPASRLPAGPGEEECQAALAACTGEARELEAAIAAQVR